MKPTQEQVLQWAREAGVYHIAPNVAGSLLYMSQASLYRGFFLAYEAGRKDEREACARVAESYEPRCDTCPSGVSNAIRARREQ